MVPSATSLIQHLSNPLVTSAQLRDFTASDTASSTSARFATLILGQAAGILLRLPQQVIAASIVLLQRYLVADASHPSTDSTPSQSQSLHQLSAASIYLAAKASVTPLSPRSVINVYAYLTRPESSPLRFITNKDPQSTKTPDPHTYYVSEGDYQRSRLQLFHHESLLLAGLGFDIHVALPHQLALTYLSAFGTNSDKLAKRVFEHLNGALLSPQLLYLTHQPNVLATAAIYLAAREVGVKLVEEANWWEVFDVDREALGFCVMAMGSLEGFAQTERERWGQSTIDLG